MRDRWLDLWHRAAALRRERGTSVFVSAAVRDMRRWALRYRTVDVFRYPLDVVPPTPQPTDLPLGSPVVLEPGALRTGSDALAALTACDRRAPARLARGATALCVVDDAQLVHVTWMARCEAAKRAFDTLPFRVDFAAGEACTGGILTVPGWRGRGIGRWAVAAAHRHLHDIGCSAVVNAIEIHNLASLRLHERFGPTRIARLRCLRLFGLEVGKRVAGNR